MRRSTICLTKMPASGRLSITQAGDVSQACIAPSVQFAVGLAVGSFHAKEVVPNGAAEVPNRYHRSHHQQPYLQVHQRFPPRAGTMMPVRVSESQGQSARAAGHGWLSQTISPRIMRRSTILLTNMPAGARLSITQAGDVSQACRAPSVSA